MIDKELAVGNMLLETQSYIGTLDRLKDTQYYAGDIKLLVNQLLNKLQSKYKKQLINMYSAENAEVAMNLMKDLDKFNVLAVNEKQIVTQMTEYYLQDPTFWRENFVLFFDKLK